MSDIKGERDEQMYWVKYPCEQYKFTDADGIDKKYPVLIIKYLEQKYLTASEEIAPQTFANAWNAPMRKNNLNYICVHACI